ncbi:hypothetical protein ACOSQ2_008281 [Xanthoceras sorbifolium]
MRHPWNKAPKSSLSLSRNGEPATVDVVTAVVSRTGTAHGGCLDRSSRLRFGVLDLQISYRETAATAQEGALK